MPRFLDRIRAAINPSIQAAQTVAPFFNVIPETEEAPAEIIFYGDVCESEPCDFWTGEPLPGMRITLENVLNELERVRDASQITIRLNSAGGDLFAGIAIHNLLKSFEGKKTVIVDGLAASAASVIMCAGDVVKVFDGSMVMIHNVSSFLFGYMSTQEVRELLASHEAAEVSLKRIYARKCGKPEDELQSLIDATTWYVGADAVEAGFADELIETALEESENGEAADEAEPIDAMLTNGGRVLMVAGVPHNVAALGTLPSWLTAQAKVSNVAAAAREYKSGSGGATPAADVKEDQVTIQIATDLRNEYPEQVAAIELEAAAAERGRIQAIEAIQNRVSPALVNEAKYEHPMTAEQLALRAMQADAGLGASMLNAIDEDGDNATDDGEQVEAEPSSPTQDDDGAETEKEEVNAAVSLYNKAKGRR